MAEPILNKSMEKAQSESYLSITSNDIKINLSKEFLEELQKNTYHGWIDEDVIDHIAKVLEIVDLIRVPGTDSHQLRMKIFPLSLTDEARQWWIDEGEGKIAVWEELVEKFFCKFYADSYDGEDESYTTDGAPKKEVQKAEKFEAIQYSLGPNEEYIAIKSYEYDIGERNEDNLSIIYQDIFKKKDEGWKCFPGDNPECYLILLSSLSSQTSIWRIRSTLCGVLIVWTLSVFTFYALKKHYCQFCEYTVFNYLIRRPREGNIDEYWWRIYESRNLEVLES
ncbi:hypothetical protein Tco_1243650 [Tanacetum coccineum]